MSACTGPNDSPIPGKPAHHTEGGFRNTVIPDPPKELFGYWRMKYFGGYEWADHAATAHEVPVQNVDLEKVMSPPDGIQLTWLGHASFMVQMAGLNILLDPVFSDRASPFSFMGPKRFVPHPMDYKQLPKADYVVISHNHFDHLDEATIEQLGNKPIYLVPLGLKDFFTDLDIDPARVIEFDWWDQKTFGPLVVEALPAQHWSARSLFDRRETLWASWGLTTPQGNLLFVGDTGYNDVQFKEIGQKSGPYDLAILPIGAYEPRDFMKTYHQNPEEAVKMHQDVRAKTSIASHWGAFPMTAEAPMDPPQELARQRTAYGVSAEDFRTLAVGETVLIRPLNFD